MRNKPMKCLLYSIYMILMTLSSHAQDNTYPANGNVLLGTSNLTSQKLQVNGVIDIVGNTSGRAIRFYDGTNFSGGIGNNLWALGGSYGDLALYSPNNIVLGANNYERFRISNSGNIGLGISNPLHKLHIGGGDIAFDAEQSSRFIRINNSYGGAIRFRGNASSTEDRSLQFGRIDGNNSWTALMTIETNNGNVLVGTITDNQIDKLQVNGNIRAKKLTISQTNWPDYVFDSSYKLHSLSEVAQFIRQNKRLPEMPSAKEIDEQGLDLGKNQALLVKKIEELTLYLIEIKKENNLLRRRLDVLENLSAKPGN